MAPLRRGPLKAEPGRRLRLLSHFHLSGTGWFGKAGVAVFVGGGGGFPYLSWRQRIVTPVVELGRRETAHSTEELAVAGLRWKAERVKGDPARSGFCEFEQYRREAKEDSKHYGPPTV